MGNSDDLISQHQRVPKSLATVVLIISTLSNPQESKKLLFARRTLAFAEIIGQLNRVHNGKKVDWFNQKILERSC